MLPKLVVFDIAGTTVLDDHHVGKALAQAFEAHGVHVSPYEAAPLMGLPKPTAVAKLLHAHAPEKDGDLDFARAIHADFQARMLRHYAEDPGIAEVDGAMRTLDWLKRHGVFIALDTGFDRKITDTLLTRLNWKGGVIDFTVTSDEVEHGRPAPDLIRACMAHFAIEDPALVAHVGDTPSDLQSGHNARCRWNVGVTEGSHTAEILSVHPHTHLIPNVGYFPSLFEESHDLPL